MPQIEFSCNRAPPTGVGRERPGEAKHLCRRPHVSCRKTCRVSAIPPVGGWGRAKDATMVLRREKRLVAAAEEKSLV